MEEWKHKVVGQASDFSVAVQDTFNKCLIEATKLTPTMSTSVDKRAEDQTYAISVFMDVLIGTAVWIAGTKFTFDKEHEARFVEVVRRHFEAQQGMEEK